MKRTRSSDSLGALISIQGFTYLLSYNSLVFFYNGNFLFLFDCSCLYSPMSIHISRPQIILFIFIFIFVLVLNCGVFLMVDAEEHSPRNNNNIYSNRDYQSMMLESLVDEEGCIEEIGHIPEKKRRLSVDQVKALERNFEVENKLEPERKVQLAQELGLKPRQVAVWFQNRRARWKTKQLERDYGVLKSSFDNLKQNFESLQHDKDALLKEVNFYHVNFMSYLIRFLLCYVTRTFHFKFNICKRCWIVWSYGGNGVSWARIRFRHSYSNLNNISAMSRYQSDRVLDSMVIWDCLEQGPILDNLTRV